MKKLIIVRHAKSSWEHDLKDKDRPLMTKGIERAKNHALILKDKLEDYPEYWVTSHALRALQTAVIFSSEFDQFENLKIDEDLYTFSPSELKAEIALLPNDMDHAIVFGHNDACRLLISELTNEVLAEFKTASVAVMEFEQDYWVDISEGKLKFIISQGELQ